MQTLYLVGGVLEVVEIEVAAGETHISRVYKYNMHMYMYHKYNIVSKK